MSDAIVIAKPAPAAAPLTAAMIGCGIARTVAMRSEKVS